MDRLDILGPIAIAGGFFLASGFVLGLIIVGVNPWIIDKVDGYLSPIASRNSTFTKVFPICGPRLGWYGFVILFHNTRLIRRWVLDGRNDRVKAIKAAPKWVRHTVIWLYFGFYICAVIAFPLVGIGMLIDKYWL